MGTAMSFKNIRIVADSCCDIPSDVARQLKIGVVPVYVNYAGKSFADDGKQLDRTAYYNQMPTLSSHPTTAAPPPVEVERVIRPLLDEADHVVMLTVPAALSGIYNAFRLGTSDLPADRLTLIDSGTLTMGMGFQAMLAAEVAQKTGDLSAVLDMIERVRRHTLVYAVPETMEFLRRSGRVGWAAAGAAALLQIKPIVRAVEGEVTSIARVRTFAKAIDKLIELVQAQAPLERVALLHTNNPEGAAEMRTRLASLLPNEVHVMNVTPVIGTHIGPGALGVVTLNQGYKR